MNKKNILITGGNGFIGKNLLEYLGKKNNIFSPTHKELDLLSASQTAEYFKTHKIDIVIHTAVVGGSRKEEYENNMFYDNLKIFFNIVRNKKYFKKMINFGSGAEYDKRFPIIKVKEEDFDKKVPIDEYGYYKYVCSKYIESTNNFVSLRIFGLYGKYEDYRYRFISNAICMNLLGLPITLNKNVCFDYLFIDDFVKIVDYFINNDAKYKFYNIGRGKSIDLVTIAEKINTIADKKSKIIVKNKGLNNEYTCNILQLKKEIKNIEFTDFDESLKDLYYWYKSRKNLFKDFFIKE